MLWIMISTTTLGARARHIASHGAGNMMSVSMTMSLSAPASVRGAVCARKAGAGRRRAMMIRTEAAFFDRFTKTATKSATTEDDDEGDMGAAYASYEEGAMEEEEEGDVRRAVNQSFSDALGMFDKLKANVSQTIDLEEVEVVEEDVITPVKKGGNAFGEMLRKQAEKAEKQRAILEQDYEQGVAPTTRLRADRSAGGAPVAAFTGGNVGEGTWTLSPVVDEGSKGKRLPTLTIKRGETKIIGRSKAPGVDIAVPLPCVSSIHMQLETEGNKLFARDLGSTNGTYVEGFEVKQNRRFRIFNGATLRLGAENFNGEPYATFKASLAGAKELEKDSEYGQLNYFMEVLGGPQVVVKFVGVNLVFQLVFFLLLQLQ